MLSGNSHRRLNLLTGEWVLVSPHRTRRPWQGQVEPPPRPASASYEPGCYLCPGNERAGAARNPRYESTFVFDNDFAALSMDSAGESINDAGLLVAEAERGICRVVCFSPDHSLTLASMSLEAVEGLVAVWTRQFLELGSMPDIGSVQIFENRGEMMGASNPHPHGQIWASQSLPNELAKEDSRQREYHNRNASCLLCDYLALEDGAGQRIVCEVDGMVALTPFWAVWPFETMILSRRHLGAMDEFNSAERRALAQILRRLTAVYDRVFDAPFPYTMGFHQRPTDGAAYPHFHFHGHFYPPLLRSATVKKFMVGFEMLGMPQRDITPESAAERLRALSLDLDRC
jgi:UDPglucose--hexose-1-phosphate uridylyltransferase